MLIIIVGLPASGKTTYYNNNEILRDNYKFHDDFIFRFFDGDVIDELKNGNNICVADPRLCNITIFKRIMTIFEEYIDKTAIKLILFKNDKENCLLNAIKRKNKNVEEMINEYSKIYNLEEYNEYNCEIMEVFT
jgi:tRNA uridine 5-carbamoylmethylation protein Kti12